MLSEQRREMMGYWAASYAFAQHPWVQELLAEYDAERERADRAEQEHAAYRDRCVAEVDRLEALHGTALEWQTLAFALTARLHELEHGGTPERPWRNCREERCRFVQRQADVMASTDDGEAGDDAG